MRPDHDWHVLYTRYLRRITDCKVTGATDRERADSAMLVECDKAAMDSIGIRLESAA